MKHFEDYYGASVPEMKSRYRDDQKSKLLLKKMQYNLMSDIQITPKEVEEFFNKIQRIHCHISNLKWRFLKLLFPPKVNDGRKEKKH